MTALIASTSRVSRPQRGATLHSTRSGSPPRAATKSATFAGVGGTTGRPSVQPGQVVFDEVGAGLDGGGDRHARSSFGDILHRPAPGFQPAPIAG